MNIIGIRRRGIAVTALTALGGVLVTVGPASAEILVPCDPDDPGPIIEMCESSITLPPGGIVTIPGLGGPEITLPPGGIVTIPGLGDSDTTTTEPVDPPPSTMAPPADGSAGQPESPGESGLLLPAVRITEAVVECDGSVRVAYETDADPALAVDAEHLVSVSPLRIPDMVMSRRLVQQPLDGAFAADIAAPVDDYRVFVLVDFEPANSDGVVLADETTAPAPTDCPAG